MSKQTKESVAVLDAHDTLPMYYGTYDEDGHLPLLKHPHAWLVFVTLTDGHCYYSVKRENFSVFNQEDMDAANKRAQQEADKLTEGSDFNADPTEWVSFPYPVYGSRAWMEEQAFYRRTGQINKL